MNKIDKKAQLNVGGLVMIAMGVIVCLVILSQVFNTQSLMTDRQPVINQTLNIAAARTSSAGDFNMTPNFTVTNYPSGWKADGKCPLVWGSLGNNTYIFTRNTDYLVDENTGIVAMLNTSRTVNSTQNLTLATYTYCDDGYNTDGSSRSIAGLIGLFCAIALLVWLAQYGLSEWMS